jgi:hypothetical protein
MKKEEWDLQFAAEGVEACLIDSSLPSESIRKRRVLESFQKCGLASTLALPDKCFELRVWGGMRD